MKNIFLDAASNTNLDPEVLKAMKNYLNESFVGNSRSIHDFGIKASQAVEDARSKLGCIFGVPAENIIFTSGATEGNNTVIKSLAYRELSSKKKKKDQKRHIICGATEHDSVINPCKQLEKIGFEVTYIKPHADGKIYLQDVKSAVKLNTMLICIMAVNNELGVENQTYEITNYAKEVNIPTLVDCTQLVSYGKESLWLRYVYPAASFFTFSGHKIYGPLGTGCLVANGDSIELLKGNGLIVGGAQELSIRGGTSNVTGIVGLAQAVELMELQSYSNFYSDLYSYLVTSLTNLCGDLWSLNVVPDHKNIISLNFEKYFDLTDSLAADLAIRGVGVSAGSACDSDHDETEGAFNPSHVLVAMGYSENTVRNTIRVSFCKSTTKKDIDYLVSQIKSIKEYQETLKNI